MLHILFLILKIIGILLLVILGLLILLLSIVLFVPIRYQVYAEVPEDKDKICAEVRVSWLLKIVKAVVNYREKQLEWNVKIFWKKWTADAKSEEPTQKKEQEEIATTVLNEIVEDIENDIDEIADDVQKDAEEENEEIETSVPEEQPKKKKKVFEKIKYTIRSICDKIKGYLEIKDKIVEFLKDEIHQRAFLKLKKEVIWLLKHLFPKKIHGSLKYGTGDPYMTGKILAGLSIAYPFYGEQFEVEPDFMNAVLEGKISVQGKLRMITFVIPLWRLVWDKNIRKLYKDIKNWKQ